MAYIMFPGQSRPRKIGAGFGDFIGSTLGGIGAGLGGGVHNLLGSLFGGKSQRGGADVMAKPPPTSLLGKINRIAQESGVINKALDQFGMSGLAAAAKTLGYGKKKAAKKAKKAKKQVGGLSKLKLARHKGKGAMKLNY